MHTTDYEIERIPLEEGDKEFKDITKDVSKPT